MAAPSIPRHKRFAVRQNVRLRASNGDLVSGMMIEVSLDACRISASGHHPFHAEQVVTVEVDGFGDFRGIIRSAGEHSLVIRFVQPVASAELQELVWSASDASRPILHLPTFGI